MKIWKRTLSVGLSLVLCGSMVLPGFAASFSDLQNAIDGSSNGIQIDGTDRWGYGQKNDETGKWGIEAWGDSTDRNVQLNEDVNYGENSTNGKESTKTITINGNVTLDLNGNNVDGKNKNGSSVITIKKGSELTLEDNTAQKTTDAAGKEVYTSGKITGGSGYDGGVSVSSGAALNLNSGTISGNQSYGVSNSGKFQMSNGVISDNKSANIRNEVGGSAVMTGGTIKDGATAIDNLGTFSMANSLIIGHKGTNSYNSTIHNQGELTIKNSTITGNKSFTNNHGTIYMFSLK